MILFIFILYIYTFFVIATNHRVALLGKALTYTSSIQMYR